MQRIVLTASWKRVWGVSAIIFLILSFAVAFSRGSFDFTGLKLGVMIGTGFAAFPLFYGLGQRIEISEDEVIYSAHLGDLVVNNTKKRIPITEVEEVRLGKPRLNKGVTTFAAMNITGKNREITFNPDLFESSVLVILFKELKLRKPGVKFDEYVENLIEKGSDGGVFRKKVFRNLLKDGDTRQS
jgi:hypothetical protein